MNIKSYKQYEEMTVEYEKGGSEAHLSLVKDSGWDFTQIDIKLPLEDGKTTYVYTYRKEIK